MCNWLPLNWNFCSFDGGTTVLLQKSISISLKKITKEELKCHLKHSWKHKFLLYFIAQKSYCYERWSWRWEQSLQWTLLLRFPHKLGTNQSSNQNFHFLSLSCDPWCLQQNRISNQLATTTTAIDKAQNQGFNYYVIIVWRSVIMPCPIEHNEQIKYLKSVFK